MSKFDLLFLIAGFLAGIIGGVLIAYSRDNKLLHDVVNTYESGLDDINNLHKEETKRLYDLVAHYQRQHENCPYRRGAFHCVSPEPLKRSEIDWQELDFPNNKEDKT